MTEIIEARWRLISYEVDFCDTPKEHLALLEKKVEIAKEIENEFDRLAKLSPGLLLPLLNSKVNRLNAEIEWEKAKAVQSK